MRYLLAALFVVAALPLSAAPAAAQGILPFTVEGRAGMAFPVDDFASGVEAGYLLEATAKLSPLPFATLYGGWSYAEFAADGRELRRWGKPYSAEIVAVVGERLHFRARHDDVARTFWTLADGSVGLLDDTLANPAAAPAPGFAENAEAIDCPALPVFAGSDYLQCYEIAGDDGAARRFAWEGACS